MRPAPTAQRKAPNGIDQKLIHRRRIEVNRLRADGYTQREIADMLLEQHTSGGTRLFTFITPTRTLADESRLTSDEKRQRAYATVRDDVAVHRKEAHVEQPDAERLADDRYLLGERYRMLFKRTIERMEGNAAKNITPERNNGKWGVLARTAVDLAARIARLQGIETEKPIEIRLPERYRAWIDDDGIIHRTREDDVPSR